MQLTKNGCTNRLSFMDIIRLCHSFCGFSNSELYDRTTTSRLESERMNRWSAWR